MGLTFLLMVAGPAEVFAQWVRLNSGTTDELDGVFFTDANTGYAVGMDSVTFRGLVLKTTNGGNSWTSLGVSCMIAQSPYFTDANTGYVAAYDTLLKTTNAGAAWSRYPINMGLVMFGLTFYNSTIGYAAGINFPPSSTAAVLKTTDAGVSWTPHAIPVPSHFHPNAIFCTSANTCYLAGGYALKTTDGGTTWNTMNTPNIADWSSVYFTSPTNGVIVGGNTGSGTIIRTTDGGTSWSTVYSATGFLSSVFFADVNTGYAAGWAAGPALRTTNGGITWAPQTSPANSGIKWIHFPTPTTGYAVGNSGMIMKYTGPTDAPDEPAYLPTHFALGQNYPNPFNPSTTISYALPADAHVTLKVYDVLGREVRTLVNDDSKVGTYETRFDASGLASGVYLYRLQAGGFVQSRELVLMK